MYCDNRCIWVCLGQSRHMVTQAVSLSPQVLSQGLPGQMFSWNKTRTFAISWTSPTAFSQRWSQLSLWPQHLCKTCLSKFYPVPTAHLRMSFYEDVASYFHSDGAPCYECLQHCTPSQGTSMFVLRLWLSLNLSTPSHVCKFFKSIICLWFNSRA